MTLLMDSVGYIGSYVCAKKLYEKGYEFIVLDNKMLQSDENTSTMENKAVIQVQSRRDNYDVHRSVSSGI